MLQLEIKDKQYISLTVSFECKASIEWKTLFTSLWLNQEGSVQTADMPCTLNIVSSFEHCVT